MRHGIRAAYVSGCRCDACTRANTLYRRRERAGLLQRQGTPIVRHDVDTLLVHCWCDTTPLRVPKVDLLEGRTLSCGRRGCFDRRAS